jgi:hypothetical protein
VGRHGEQLGTSGSRGSSFGKQLLRPSSSGEALLSYMAMSTAAIQKALERDDSILEGGGSTGSGFKSYMAGEKDMKDKPVEFVRNWYANAKREVHHHEGKYSPFRSTCERLSGRSWGSILHCGA